MTRTLAVLAFAFALGAAPGARSQDTSALDLLNSLPDMSQPVAPGDWCVAPGATLGHTAVRLTTQLLVTSVSCGQAYGNDTLYDRYLAFTGTQEDLLEQSRFWIEQQARADGEDATAALSDFRSEIANMEAQIISERGRQAYCNIRAPRFGTLIGVSADAFRAYATDVHGRNAAARRQCLTMVD